ncbi:MAG: ExbD/TolR family protein [Flavobacteriia bacterium]|jgi:biopolymer transport protein ExbD
MAEIAEGGGGGHDKGKKRAKKSSTRVDMTPMVDLAFLLLTFFVLTSTFSKPKVMSLVYPAKPDPAQEIEPQKINNAITFLLTEDKIFYYSGQYYPVNAPGPKGPTVLEETDFSAKGVRKLLADRNAFVLKGKEGLDKKLKAKQIQDSTYLRMLVDFKKDPESLKVLIKTDDKATCKNFIDLIDELKIAEIGVIAPVDILASELDLVNQKIK